MNDNNTNYVDFLQDSYVSLSDITISDEELEEYFFKKIELNETREGWSVISELVEDDSKYLFKELNLISTPEAWCGIEFKISLIPISPSSVLILGNPDLEDCPIDREDLIVTLKKVLMTYKKNYDEKSKLHLGTFKKWQDKTWNSIDPNYIDGSVLYKSLNNSTISTNNTITSQTNGLC